jgi:hypothetical protein
MTRPNALRLSAYSCAAAASARGTSDRSAPGVRRLRCTRACRRSSDGCERTRTRSRRRGRRRSALLRVQRPRLIAGAGPGVYPDADERPAVREHADAVDEVLAADRVDDDAARAGQLAGAFHEAVGRIVDPWSSPSAASRPSFSSLEAIEITVAPAIGDLNRGHPDAAGSGVDQNRLALAAVNRHS